MAATPQFPFSFDYWRLHRACLIEAKGTIRETIQSVKRAIVTIDSQDIKAFFPFGQYVPPAKAEARRELLDLWLDERIAMYQKRKKQQDNRDQLVSSGHQAGGDRVYFEFRILCQLLRDIVEPILAKHPSLISDLPDEIQVMVVKAMGHDNGSLTTLRHAVPASAMGETAREALLAAEAQMARALELTEFLWTLSQLGLSHRAEGTEAGDIYLLDERGAPDVWPESGSDFFTGIEFDYDKHGNRKTLPFWRIGLNRDSIGKKHFQSLFKQFDPLDYDPKGNGQKPTEREILQSFAAFLLDHPNLQFVLPLYLEAETVILPPLADLGNRQQNEDQFDLFVSFVKRLSWRIHPLLGIQKKMPHLPYGATQELMTAASRVRTYKGSLAIFTFNSFVTRVEEQRDWWISIRGQDRRSRPMYWKSLGRREDFKYLYREDIINRVSGPPVQLNGYHHEMASYFGIAK